MLEWTPALRRVARSRLRWRIEQALRAAAVLRPRVGFLLAEFSGSSLRRYRTRQGDVVLVRHQTRDVEIVTEVLARGDYRAPPALAARLRGPIEVIDAGANIGLFGVHALETWTVRRLVSYEPDPGNASILERVVALNRETARWTVRRSALGTAAGPIRFAASGSPESRRAAGDEPGIEVSCEDLFAVTAAGADLLKLDIEGGEWPILLDPRLAELPVRVIVLEWHWRGAPGPAIEHEAHAALVAAGFDVHRDGPGSAHGAVGILWASRPDGWRAPAA